MPAPRAAVLTAIPLAALLAGCSSGPEPPARSEPVPVELGGTTWIGPCSGTGTIGAYSFTFRPGPGGDGGTVEVGAPDATAVRPVPYTVTRTGQDGFASFSLAFDPPWKGTLRRDYRNLTLSFQVGEVPGVRRCDLQRASRPEATG